MGINEINNASYGNLTNTIIDYSVDSLELEGSSGTETTYLCDYSKWNGYYKTIGILKSVIDKKALWTVGKGYKTKESTKKILDRIKGFGKDSFNSLMFNAVVTYTTGGDFFAEIVKDKAGRLINLKPLNPGSIRIVADEFGIIKRYEQVSRAKKIVNKFSPDQIFHLCKDRVGDEIHGVSTIEKIENDILSYGEAKGDLKKLFHRNVVPIHVFKLDTDDPTKIAAFKSKADAAVINGENLFIPMGSVEVDKINIPMGSTLNPLPWIEELEKLLIMCEGVPGVILGDSKNTTESSSKILYLAFQQMVEWNQLFLEDQLKLQLNLDIEFEFPVSLEQNLQNDNKKDKNQTEVKGVSMKNE